MKFYYSILLFVVFFSSGILAQESFKTGYFITDSGDRVECLIHDPGWRSNPEKFEYKLEENAEVKTATLEEVSEFVLEIGVKFIRRKVNIEMLSNSLSSITHNPYPEYKEEEMFLKVLVEGTASLYYYAKQDAEVFLYDLDGGEIKQLVYKKFWIDRAKTKVGVNADYLNELKNNVSFYTDYFKEPEYTEKGLVNYFVQYNTDLGNPFTTYIKSRSARMVLSPIVGVQKTSFDFDHNRDQYDRSFEGNTYKFGVLYEYQIPFNNYRWGFLLEPSISFFDKSVQKDEWSQPFSVETKRLEFGIGVRRYFPITQNAIVFANGSMPLTMDIPTKIQPGYGSRNLEVSYITFSYSLGLGVRISRFSIEARYDNDRDIVPYAVNYYTSVGGVSLIAAFAILN